MTNTTKGAAVPPPPFNLSDEDNAIVGRWIEEVGEERLLRIAKAVSARKRGRPTSLTANMPLLRKMADLQRRNSSMSVYGLAKKVASSPDGENERTRRGLASADSLARTLKNLWSKYSRQILRERIPQRPIQKYAVDSSTILNLLMPTAGPAAAVMKELMTADGQIMAVARATGLTKEGARNVIDMVTRNLAGWAPRNGGK